MKIGIGYVIGCLISILLWKLDRQNFFSILNKKLKKKVKNVYALQFLYFCAVIVIYVVLSLIKASEVYNALTALIVIDISNTERKNLKIDHKKHFYDTISTISRALVCGFIAPILYVLVLGNAVAIVFTLLYNVSLDEDLNILGMLVSVANIIPSFIAGILL
jgi:hypothetical protein